MKLHDLRLILLGSGLLLQGCPAGDEYTPPPICRMLGGGASTVSANPALLFSNAGAAFDGSLASFATLSTTGATTAILRGTAQSGVVAAAGEIAGIAFTRPADGDSIATVTITTYLGGAPRESLAGGSQSGNSQACSGTCIVRDGLAFIGAKTAQTFDAIEAQISWTGAAPMEIRELCLGEVG